MEVKNVNNKRKMKQKDHGVRWRAFTGPGEHVFPTGEPWYNPLKASCDYTLLPATIPPFQRGRSERRLNAPSK